MQKLKQMVVMRESHKKLLPCLLLCKVQYPPTRDCRSYATGIIHSPLVWVLSCGSGENIA